MYIFWSANDWDPERPLSGVPDNIVTSDVGAVDGVADTGQGNAGESNTAVGTGGGLGGGESGAIGAAGLRKYVSLYDEDEWMYIRLWLQNWGSSKMDFHSIVIFQIRIWISA